MATIQTQRYCKTCDGQCLFTKQGTNNILHLLLSLFSGGLWLPVWFLMAVSNAFQPFRCTRCGGAKLS